MSVFLGQPRPCPKEAGPQRSLPVLQACAQYQNNNLILHGDSGSDCGSVSGNVLQRMSRHTIKLYVRKILHGEP